MAEIEELSKQLIELSGKEYEQSLLVLRENPQHNDYFTLPLSL